jgi:hypothetical protein
VETDGHITARFTVPDHMYVGYQYDVDDDGVTEAIVELHSAATPAQEEGIVGIVSVKNGTYREVYRGERAISGSCSRYGEQYSQVALGVRRGALDVIEIVEEQWLVGCDPGDVQREVGEWKLASARTSTIDL